MECFKIANNCRACQIKTEEESQRIFIFNTVKLPDIFKETTSLDINENDGLPKVLCSTCYDRLLEAYNFRKMCSAAVLYFQKILSMDVPEEKYTATENLTDVHLTDATPENIKTEPELDIPNSPPPRDPSCPPDGNDSLTDISDTLPNKSILQEDLNNLVWCGICNSKFRRKPRLEMHMRVKHLALKPCECKICGKQLTSEASLDYHMVAKHGKRRPFPCPKSQCEKHFDTKSDLKYHMETKHAIKKPVPSGPKDPSSLENSSTSEVTKSIDNQKTNNEHSCGICGAKNITADDPDSHMNTHLKDDMWCCLFCSYKSDKRESLEQHVKDVHHGIKNYHCPHCDKIFVTAMGMKQHTLRLKGILNFKCKFCDIRKVSLAEIRRHENTHTKDKIFSCEFCPHKSTCKRNMRNHVKIVHQGVKNFHCPHCERSFGTAKTLKYHVLTHTGEKPYECTECGKRFTQGGNLTIHMKNHIKSESESQIKEEIQDSS
ncbi:zinc finger protein OZF-like [Phlebotomus papatasi]|uniref:zinc finger protein OZF-like n=1 Tax=Phlebotomus papatasi TaxID=29031 RepID=UPI0024836891|nr:zinc finger protein OZF-like [Phlebotomus papatasi]